MTLPAHGVTPVAAVRIGGARARHQRPSPPAGAFLKSLVAFALTVLYPFHLLASGRGTVSHPGGINISLGDGVVGLIALLLVFRFAAGAAPLPRFGVNALVLLVIIGASLAANAVALTAYFSVMVGMIETLKLLAVILWMVAVFWLTYDDFPRRFLLFAGTSVALACGFAIMTVLENVLLHVPRPSGPFDNPNIYGNYLALNFFLALGVGVLLADRGGDARLLGQRIRRWLRPVLRLFVLPALLVGLLATGSRGALVGFIAGLPFAVPWNAVKRVTIRHVVALLCGGVVLALVLAWFFDQHPFLLKRLSRTSGDDPNVVERLALWRTAFRALATHPVLGIGYGQFPGYAESQVRATVTHNTYLSYAAELGLVGIAAFVWLWVSVIRGCWQAKRRTGSSFPAMLCGFVVASSGQAMFANVDQFRAPWIAFGLVAALLYHIGRAEPCTPPRQPAG